MQRPFGADGDNLSQSLCAMDVVKIRGVGPDPGPLTPLLDGTYNMPGVVQPHRERATDPVDRILRDAGYEVIYTGLFQTPETVAAAAVGEDVDAIGLSMLSGAHMTLPPLVVEEVRKRASDIPVILGGIVPDYDLEALAAAGIGTALTPGSTAEQIATQVAAALVAHPVA
jgi:methylmalonyl-CoA mutase C-terminal domain/subunit